MGTNVKDDMILIGLVNLLCYLVLWPCLLMYILKQENVYRAKVQRYVSKCLEMHVHLIDG